MATRSPESSTRLDKESRHTAVQLSGWLLAVVAIAYALLAGLHTLQDFDLGWQLATGRWVVQHRHVFSTDVFSYTAAGQPWIYPVLSGVAFYLVYLTGGYALLSWLGAIACASDRKPHSTSRRDVHHDIICRVPKPVVAALPARPITPVAAPHPHGGVG